ncbi:Pimeloyl-ACP methyl ester carboxylesterase [Filimonas lacunae]|uniref:Pimeloyl-ACP methyl ester carboxylesterase n=1 Tax=Filimonas lacunae TaxID=477680 RepID=A0A173MBH9_9BACT|nr:alpha/beta fold hydrolase [Filimonas lacunae]BAV04905.1 salicylate esterase [Filimonas lacunae]SIT33823.1 Pimeloyl-ACP methyl ester carboxylesterase [Filimonas lacunae]
MKKMRQLIWAALTGGIVLMACSKDDKAEAPPAKTYVLVHGAWQAPYVWDSVRIRLEKDGAKVVVVALPGHGADTTAPASLTLNVYQDKVIKALDGVSGKVILVGHSLGGMVISAVGEKVPERIEKLIYIGAYLPQNGQSLLDLANTDADSQLRTSLRPSPDFVTLDVVREELANIFIQDGSEKVKAAVLANYRAEPGIPFSNPVTLTAGNYGRLEKVYIKTLQDHVVSPSLQDRMIAAGGITKTYQLNTSHSPFLSKPDSVSIALEQLAQ